MRNKQPFSEENEGREASYALFESVLCAFLLFFLSIFFHIKMYRNDTLCRIAIPRKLDFVRPWHAFLEAKKPVKSTFISLFRLARCDVKVTVSVVTRMARCTEISLKRFAVGCLEYSLRTLFIFHFDSLFHYAIYRRLFREYSHACIKTTNSVRSVVIRLRAVVRSERKCCTTGQKPVVTIGPIVVTWCYDVAQIYIEKSSWRIYLRKVMSSVTLSKW